MVYFYSPQTSVLAEEEVRQINKSELLVKLKELFKSTRLVALDVETTGLDPLRHKVVMLQLGFKNIQLVIDTRGFDFSVLKPFLERKSIVFVGHNIKFDYNMLKQYGIILHKIYDTMLADKVIYNGKYTQSYIRRYKRFSLAGVYYHYFEIKPPKTIRNEFTELSSKSFTYDQILYGAKDVVYPLEIYEKQQYWIKKYKLQKTVNLENKSVLAVADIEYNGINIDPTKWLKLHEKYALRIIDTQMFLDKELIKQAPQYEQKAYQLSLFGDNVRQRFTAVNWNSDQQVYKILTEVFNVFPEDKDGNPSSGTPALLLLREKPHFVDLLIQYRKEAKVISSFGKTFLEKHLGKDNRLHSQFNQMVDTGRMSSRNPNMQQIPSDAEFRSAFVAPEGKVIVSADYSNQEGRIMADKAKDKDYIDFFNYGDGDVHSFVATKMFSAAFGREFIVTKTNENKEYRQKGKILNFMISFGGSAFTLSKTLKITIKEAEKLISSFYSGFPTLKNLFTKNKQYALEHGYIRTNNITKRIRWIPEWEEYQNLNIKQYHELTKEERSQKAKLKGRIERKGMNTPVQGTAGDMTKTALILAREELLRMGIKPTKEAKIKLINVVHDEILMEADKEFAEQAAEILKNSMERAGKYFIKYIQMTAVPEISDHWEH